MPTSARLLPLALVLLALLAGLARVESPSVMAQPGPSDFEDACRTPNPYLAAAILGGPPPDEAGDYPAVVGFRHGLESAGKAPAVLARRSEVGDVYGLAYAAGERAVYASAYHRVGGAYGPAGPGGIYRIDLEDGSVTELVRLEAGPDVHGSGDPAAIAAMVGKVGLGDLEIADSGTELYVANLYDGEIYRIALPQGTVRDHVPNGEGRPDTRPFGLAVRAGWLYHALVRTGESGGALEASVYRALPGMRDAHRVLAFGLDYARTFQSVPWAAWKDQPGDYDAAMAADVAFRADGAPIVGLRDRVSDMDPWAVWRADSRPAASVGDIVPARISTDALTWEAIRRPPWYQDSGPDNIEVTFGALAKLSTLDVIASIGRDRDAPAGDAQERLMAYWFSNDSGSLLRSEPVFEPPAGSGGDLKLAPGDVEVLCSSSADVPPEMLATGTAEARAAATARASEAAIGRATEHAATQTAIVPVRQARETAAVSTAAVVVPALTAEAPTQRAAEARAGATAAAIPPKLTALAPTGEAMATRRARPTELPPETATAAASAYDVMKGSCGSHNPYMVTTRFVPRLDGNGDPYGPWWLLEQPAVVAFNDTDPEDATLHYTLAVEPEVGAVYGVGYDLVRDQVYLGAYTKRLAELGPLGPGGIYRIDLRTGVTVPWALLDAGRDPHRIRDDFDLVAASAVGFVGLGDLEVAEAADELYAVNLADKLIYRFSVPDGQLLGAFPHGGAGQWWEADAVPFGLAVRGGHLYHAVVDTAMTQGDEPRPPRAFVYRSAGDGSGMLEVARVSLDYARGPTWQSWHRTVPEDTTRPQPIPADIEFRLDGDLILGLRDRVGDARILRAGHGDMVLTMGVSGDRFIPLTEPEVYRDNIRHAESSWGGLAALPWLDETVSTVIDPIHIYSGGAGWFDNVGGGVTRLEQVYRGANQTFGKSAGLGDIEALCVALTPTPSPTARDTATVTPSATLTPSPTPTGTITPSATPGHYRIYLPIVEREPKCVPQAVHSDVILVLDMSTSMYRRTLADRTKHEAAIEAARLFADLMSFVPDEGGGYDQLAVVGFNDVAWTQQPLTNDRAAIDRAMPGLLERIQEGTRIDLAFLEAIRNAESSERRGVNQPVVILMTDGLPNRVPTPAPIGSQEETVADRARQAKERGIRVFTVGLGEPDDVLRPLLEACASDRSMYYYAPDGEDLLAIYRAIAGRIIACP